MYYIKKDGKFFTNIKNKNFSINFFDAFFFRNKSDCLDVIDVKGGELKVLK